MKKPKISLDPAKVQLFFFHHIEKILLVVVVGIMLLLIWQGMSMPGLESKFTAQGLKQESATTDAFIREAGRWAVIAPNFTPPMDIKLKASEGQRPTDPQAFYFPTSLNRPNFPKHNPRSDPKLFAPERVIVYSIVGPLAGWAKMNETDPLVNLPPTDLEPARVVRQIKSAKPKAKSPDGGEFPGGSPDGGVPGPGGRPKKTRTKKGKEDPLGGDFQAPAGPGPGAFGGDGMNGGQLPELYPESYTEGYVPQSADQTVARNVAANVIMAVVPYLKQIEAYETALAQSLDYDSTRDYPAYLKFQVQRADVTANPTGPIDWSTAATIDPQIVINKQIGRADIPGEWAGFATEVVDPYYTDPVLNGGMLTHPAPPYLQRDLWPMLTHPDVPLATSEQFADPGAGQPGGAAAEDPGELLFPVNPAGGTGGGLPGGGFPGGVPGPGMGGSRDGGRGGEGGYSRPMGPPGGFGGSATMSGRNGVDGGMSGNGMQVIAPPKYKLIRMTDTEIKPGRKYSYRIRVWLHDPNHPAPGFVVPNPASLDSNVQKRVSEVDAALKAAKTARQKQMAYVVMSDWSQPSAPAELPSTDRFFAVNAQPPKGQSFAPKTPIVPVDQPKAELATVVWDPIKVVDVAAETTVFRGSLLNMTQDTKVIHPVTKQVVEQVKYPFVTNAIVADMQGGEQILPVLDRLATPEALKSPGELLIIDAGGKLRVLDEVTDLENIRRYTIPKPPPAAPATQPGDLPGNDPLQEGGGRPRRPARGSPSS